MTTYHAQFLSHFAYTSFADAAGVTYAMLRYCCTRRARARPDEPSARRARHYADAPRELKPLFHRRDYHAIGGDSAIQHSSASAYANDGPTAIHFIEYWSRRVSLLVIIELIIDAI